MKRLKSEVNEDYEQSRALMDRLFSTLDDQYDDVWVEKYVPRQVVFRRAEGRDRVWYIRKGVIDEWRGDARLCRLGPGDLLGNVTAFSPPPGERITTAICVTGCELVSMPVELYLMLTIQLTGVEARLMQRKLLRHAGHWVAGGVESVSNLTHQRFGGKRTTLVPPDYLAYPADLHIIPCQLPDALRRELPPGVNVKLIGGQAPSCLLMLAHFGELRPRYLPSQTGRLDYSEASVLIPVQCKKAGMGWFQAWAFPNNALSMFKGREVFGQPKMYGNTYIEPLVKHPGDLPGEGKSEHFKDLWRISGRSGGSTMVDLRIRYASWDKILQNGELMAALSDVMGINEGHEVLPDKEFNAILPSLKARVEEYGTLSGDLLAQTRYDWQHDSDPADEEWWHRFLKTAAMKWAMWAATGAKGEDPFDWAKESLPEHVQEVARSRSDTSGDAHLNMSSVISLYKFVPDAMRSRVLLSWKRNFTPEVATTETFMEWEPKHFSVDAIARNYLSMNRVHSLDLFELDEDLIRFRVGPRLLDFRPLVRGERQGVRGSGFYGFRVVGDALMSAHREGEEDAHEIDYLDEVWKKRLLDPKNIRERRKLAWGPAVWKVEGAEPAAGVPRTPVEDLNPLIPPRLDVDSQPGFDGIVEALEGAVMAFKNARDAKAELTGFMGVELPGGPTDGLRETIEALVGKDPKLIWLEPGDFLFDEGDDRDVAWLVIDGALEEWGTDTWLGRREPASLAGELLVLTSLPRITEMRAVLPTAVLEIPGARLRKMAEYGASGGGFSFAGFLNYHSGLEAVEGALEACYQLDVTSYQFFPGARAVVLPGPYEATNIEMAAIPICRPTDGWLERHMPPEVTWSPALPFGLLMIARFENFGPSEIELDTDGGAAYTETGLLLPALVDGKLRGHIPWIYPSSIAAMFAGRELYGYPKTYANTVFDDRFQRFVLRRSGRTSMDIPYEHREWGELAIAEVMHLFSTLGKVMAQPWTTEAADFGPLDLNPPKVQKSILPWFALLGPYMDFASAILPKLPAFLRTLPVACWKRNFSTRVRYPGHQFVAPWHSDDFDVDQMAGSGFTVAGLSECKPIRIKSDDIRIYFEGEGALVPGDEGFWQTIQPLGCLGLWMKYDMSMTTGTQLVDYLSRGQEGEPRLEFGPKARSEG